MRQRDETVKFGGQKVKVQVHMTPNLRIWSSRISSFEYKQVYRRRYEIRRSSKPKTALKNNKIKYGEKRFSIWRMELLHPAMWHVALESWQWIHQVAAPCNVTRGSGMTCRWIRPVAAPCNVTHSSGIMTLNSPTSRVRLIGVPFTCVLLPVCPSPASRVQLIDVHSPACCSLRVLLHLHVSGW